MSEAATHFQQAMVRYNVHPEHRRELILDVITCSAIVLGRGPACADLAVLIEVKGFESVPSPVEYLASAAGKYALYQAALDYLKIELPLYMAVPIAAYRGILSEELAKQTLSRSGVERVVS